MFNVISKLGTLFYEEHGEDEEDLGVQRNSRHTENAVQERTFEGTITSLHTGYGMVDSHIYCAFDTFQGFHKPCVVGDRVTVIASRKHETAGWCAVDVSPSRDWNDCITATDLLFDSHDNPSTDVPEYIVGVVSAYSRSKQSCVVNGTLTLRLPDSADSYLPQKGDWVKAKINKDDSLGVCVALSLQPVRETEFEGTITGLRQGFGYINGEIHFSFTVLENGYQPKRGDFVCGKAVESQQGGNCSWRAIHVAAKKLTALANNSLDLTSPTLTMSLNELLENKNGIHIPETIDFGTVYTGSVKSITVSIRNGWSEEQILKDCRMCGYKTESQFRILGTKRVLKGEMEEWLGSVSIEAKCAKFLVLQCNSKHLGKDSQLLLFDFGNFAIGRYVTVLGADALEQGLQPRRQFERRDRQTPKLDGARSDGWVVPGQRIQRTSAVNLPQRLPPYPVPESLRQAVTDGEDLTLLTPVLLEELTLQNYTRRFQTLLHIEEVQQEIEMQEFDLERVCMRPFAEFLALFVPGLAEGRPSLLVGDKVFLTSPAQSDGSPAYEGFIHEVLRDEILLKFHQEFHSSYMGEDYNVSFQFNRTTLRRCHNAVEYAPTNARQVLFPTCLYPKVPQTKVKVNLKPSDTLCKVVKATPVNGIRKCPIAKLRQTAQAGPWQKATFFNDKLNSRQKAAVMRILDGLCRPLPYVLFGPPGTGKTITVVEAILQVFSKVPSSRIIACAPSNSAADLLAERLHNSKLLQSNDMVRLNAFHRNVEDLPQSIRTYCNNGDDLQSVSHHRILVSTCTTVGMLFALGIKSGHFTHAFIDEAGQATEPECMIAVGLVAPGGGQVVLAGDPMQLGPVLRSNSAKMYRLELSYLERLMSMPLYQRDEKRFADHGCYDPLLVTKLVKNYRSHPALLQLPSELFYHGELEVAADPALVQCFQNWSQLPNGECPLVFHGVRGEDLREGNSPSWFNPVEAVQVMHYLKALVTYTGVEVTWDHIGVITPYRKQVEKIRVLIDSLGMDKVKVGSVEEFQGQERLAVIISTVRSNESMMQSDVNHNLGFLNSPKRFNVAITRAQALLVMVGNPHVLARDESWRSLIRYCVRQKTYIGCDLPDSCLINNS